MMSGLHIDEIFGPKQSVKELAKLKQKKYRYINGIIVKSYICACCCTGLS